MKKIAKFVNDNNWWFIAVIWIGVGISTLFSTPPVAIAIVNLIIACVLAFGMISRCIEEYRYISKILKMIESGSFDVSVYAPELLDIKKNDELIMRIYGRDYKSFSPLIAVVGGKIEKEAAKYINGFYLFDRRLPNLFKSYFDNLPENEHPKLSDFE